jgi:hypothetical protein
MRAAALRLGGQGLTATHDDHLLIIGDAAGHIDPLTGESTIQFRPGPAVCSSAGSSSWFNNLELLLPFASCADHVAVLLYESNGSKGQTQGLMKNSCVLLRCMCAVCRRGHPHSHDGWPRSSRDAAGYEGNR